MPTVRQVKSKIKVAPKPEKVVAVPAAESAVINSQSEDRGSMVRTKKVCLFCEGKSEPIYTDIQVLRRFMNDRGRISTRQRTGACAKHQRRVAREIKHARHLAMLPFVVSA